MTDYEKQRLEKNSEICSDFSADKFYKLSGLCYHVPYMEMERKTLSAAFERFQKLDRAKEKDRAWERVCDQIYRLRTIAESAISRSSKTDVGGISDQKTGLT